MILILAYYRNKRCIPFFFYVIHAVAMKIAAALGVWPFWGWKIINHGGWFTQVKGRSWQKKRSSLYRSCRHERVILPDYRITLLLQFIHHFYNTFASLLHHSFSSYVTFTSVPSSVPFVHPTPFLNVLKTVFSGCAGNASRPRNKLRPRSPFSGKKNIGNRTYPGWMAWISALCTCAHTHACRKNRACAFLAGFRVVCCLFYRFPVRNALRASQAVHAMTRYGKWSVGLLRVNDLKREYKMSSFLSLLGR